MKTARRLGGSILVAGSLVLGCRDGGDDGLRPLVPPADWGVVTFPSAKVTARVELAHTEATRTKGLMFRTELGKDSGMLFLFAADSFQGFWMRNCYMPLSIAYIRANGTIANILEMAPARDAPTPPTYDSSEPVRYALEMEKGWFARHGVKEGDRVEFSEEIRRIQPER